MTFHKVCFTAVMWCAGALTAATINVPAGGDFQAALNSAHAGDVITLAAGATFQGPFLLPVNSGSSYITIRTSAADSALPASGARIDPSYASILPKLVANTGTGQPVIRTQAGSNHYKFIGVEIRPAAGATLFQLVQLGNGNETSLNALPNDFVFDRTYLHGDPTLGTRRGIAMNAPNVTVMNSYLSDFKIVGTDSQALACWNGPGPVTITNNYVEASGENILFGGQDPTIANLVPSGIVIRQNHFSKPLSWRVGDPSYQGTHWTVKNLLELKNATQVVIDGNIFENNWADAQNGFAILFTPRNQDNTAPWSVVSNVQFTNNLVQHVASAIDILGTDDIFTSQQLHSVVIKNNLFEDVTLQWGGQARLFQMLNNALNVTFDHNTGFADGNIMMADQLPSPGLQFTNNLTNHGSFGFVGSNVAEGNATLAAYFPNSVFQRNAIIGGNASVYPSGNFFPATINSVGFVNAGAGNYSLLTSSSLHNAATDGTDVGVDMTAFNAAQSPGVPPASSISVTTTGAISLDPGGVSQTVTVTVIRTNFTGSVALSVGTLPSGVTIVSKTDPGAGSSGSVILTASAAASAVTSQPVIITASGSGVTSQSGTVLVTVNPKPSISISATSAIVLSAGGVGQTVTVNVTRTNFTGGVTLSVSALPSGVTSSLTNPGATNSGSITLTAAAGAALVSGQVITITASGSGISAATDTFSLTVTGSPTINVTATGALSLDPGGLPQTAIVAVTRTNFTGNLTLSVGTLPSGVIVMSKTDPGTGSSASVTLMSSTGAPAISNQPVILTVSGSGVTSQTATVLVTVTPRPAISINATSSITLTPGGAGQVATVNIARTNTTVPITLSVGNLPNGVTVTYNDPGAGNSGSVTFTAASSAAPVSGQAVTISASGPGVLASATLLLTVVAVSTPPLIQLTPASLSFVGAVGGGNPSPQTVNVSNSGGGTLRWTAAITSGIAWFSVPGGSGTDAGTFIVAAGSAGLPQGVYAGEVTVSAPGATSQTIAVTLTVQAAIPVINSGGIVSAAGVDAAVAPGALISIYGANFQADVSGGSLNAVTLPLPVVLGGTQVLVNGTPAPILFVSPGQINCQAPASTPAGVPLQVVVITGGVSSLPVMTTFLSYAPSAFTYPRTPDSIDPTITHADGTLVTPGSPAQAGEILVIYATGAGKVTNTPPDGSGAPLGPTSQTIDAPQVSLGSGQQQVQAAVQYSGLTAGFVGLLQINIQLPAGMPAGSGVPLALPLIITFPGSAAGAASPPVSLFVR